MGPSVTPGDPEDLLCGSISPILTYHGVNNLIPNFVGKS